MKLCFRCFKVIPSLASKCPNCLDQGQGTIGRIIFLILTTVAVIWMFSRCADKQWPFENGCLQVRTDDRK